MMASNVRTNCEDRREEFFWYNVVMPGMIQGRLEYSYPEVVSVTLVRLGNI
jgi:hypothetical protein